jgi:predicted nuclease with TOPRIM domain
MSDTQLELDRMRAANRQLSEQLRELQDRYDESEASLMAARGIRSMLENDIVRLNTTVWILRKTLNGDAKP